VKELSRQTVTPQRSSSLVRPKPAIKQRDGGPELALPLRPRVGHGFFDVQVHRTPPNRIQRKPDDEEEARNREAESKQPETKPAEDTAEAKPTEGKNQSPPSTTSTVTPGGHRTAPTGVAPCPDAPDKNIVIVGCTTAPAAAPPPKEKAELPTPSTAPFGGDADRAKFAKDLAQCHVDRVVADEITKRHTTDVEAAKKKAAAEARTESEEAVKQAAEGLTDKREIAKATAKAQIDAKKATAKKIADAAGAVKGQDVAAVTVELATKFENALTTDYDNTIKGALTKFGPGWLGTMQSRLEKKRLQITKEKNAKPKVPKGGTPLPPKLPDEIAKEIESDMTDVRCEQEQWARQQIEDIARAWAVGRREQVDFDTIKQTASNLGKFEPSYIPTTTVDIPSDVREPTKQKMVGVAPEVAEFLTQLKASPNTPAFQASTRAGHGGGKLGDPRAWAGKGFSVDISLQTTPTDKRGFWRHDTAVAFLMQLDATAKAMSARWRVLYNDFRVAEEVNAATGTRNVVFIGSSSPTDLNWHGPAGLILHFHLDLEIPQMLAPSPPATQGPTP